MEPKRKGVKKGFLGLQELVKEGRVNMCKATGTAEQGDPRNHKKFDITRK